MESGPGIACIDIVQAARTLDMFTECEALPHHQGLSHTRGLTISPSVLGKPQNQLKGVGSYGC